MCNQAPNADICYFVNAKGRIFYFFLVGVPKMTSSRDFSQFRLKIVKNDVPKIELRRFSAFPCNKKLDLTSFSVNEGRGIRI